jgi:15-cis-phytoene synthase
MGRRYATQSELYDYCARVAAAVGAMMCVLMRVRCPDALARACDLGVAMQLTNIARDVGEDAMERRLYLPTDWLAEAGLEPEAFLNNPRPTKAIRQMVRRLLVQADRLYARSEAGVAGLPRSVRPGIFAARFIYAGIGAQVQKAGYDSLTTRAHTSRPQKIGWLGLSMLRAGATMVMPKSALLYAQPLDEVRFLVDAAARRPQRQTSRSDALIGALAQLEQHSRTQRAALITGAEGTS